MISESAKPGVLPHVCFKTICYKEIFVILVGFCIWFWVILKLHLPPAIEVAGRWCFQSYVCRSVGTSPCDHCQWYHWSVTGHVETPRHVQTCSTWTSPYRNIPPDMFKRVYYVARTVGIRLKCLLVITTPQWSRIMVIFSVMSAHQSFILSTRGVPMWP